MADGPWGQYPVPAYGHVVLSEGLLRNSSICLIDYLSALPEGAPIFAVFAKKKFVRVNPYGFTSGWAIEYDNSPEVIRVESVTLPARVPNPKAKAAHRKKKSFFPEMERGLSVPANLSYNWIPKGSRR